MSIILDALSRAERDKREQADTTPSILSQTPASVTATGNKRLWIFAGTAFLAVMGLVYVFLQSVPRVPTAASETSAGPLPKTIISQAPRPRAKSRATAGDLPATRPKRNVPKAQVSTAAVDALYAKERLESAPGPANKRDIPGKVSDQAVSLSEKSGATATDTAPNAQSAKELIDVARVLQELRKQEASDALEVHATPLLDNLSTQFRDRVPTLMYSSHDYSPSGRSSVIINGETLRQGQRTRGVEVLDILSDSVILRFQSTDFRLRSLNSWVNL